MSAAFEQNDNMSKYDQIIEWFKNYWITALILILILVIMSIPQIRDGLVLIYSTIKKVFIRHQQKPDLNAPIELEVSGEKVTFTELLRSVHHDVVKIHAYTHALGVAAEHVWIRCRYPEYEFLEQSLTTIDLISGEKKYRNDQIHFDIIKIRLKSGTEKEIYFDISSFFGGEALSHMNPDEFIARKISKLYKKHRSNQANSADAKSSAAD